MTHLKRHILPENLRSAFTVCEIPLICGARLFEQTVPFHVRHREVVYG
jgi:hypothetical protein